MADHHVPPAEMSVLRVLWARGSALVRDLASELYESDEPAKLATIQKLLDRLLSKGLAKRVKVGKAYQFEPAIREEGLVALQVREMADQLSQGSLVPILSHLVKSQSLTQAELDALQLMLRSAKPTSKATKNTKR